MAPLKAIREKLNGAQGVFCRAADAIPPERWRQAPTSEQWSAAEVVAHLVVVERAIIGKADSIGQKAPLPISPLQRFHLPMWFVEARIVRRKSPLPLDESLLAEKEEMLGSLRCVRERTLAFLVETEARDLSGYYWKHPFLGMLNAYEWMEMIAAHQIRHSQQVKDIHKRISRK